MFGRGDDATGKGNEGYTLPPTTNTIVLEQEKYCLRPHEGTYKGASVFFFCTSPPPFLSPSRLDNYAQDSLLRAEQMLSDMEEERKKSFTMIDWYDQSSKLMRTREGKMKARFFFLYFTQLHNRLNSFCQRLLSILLA